MAPFTKKDENGNSKVNFIRIVESVISAIVVACLIALFARLWMLPEIKKDVETINKNLCRIESVTGNHETRIRDVEIKFAAHEAKRSH